MNKIVEVANLLCGAAVALNGCGNKNVEVAYSIMGKLIEPIRDTHHVFDIEPYIPQSHKKGRDLATCYYLMLDVK